MGIDLLIPNYLTQSGAQGSTTIDPSDYDYPTTTYAPFSDTDWWDELDRCRHGFKITRSACPVVRKKGQYNLSANYFKQDGTVIDSYYQRYQVRANTSFNVRDWLRVGENLTYAFTKDNGLSANGAEWILIRGHIVLLLRFRYMISQVISLDQSFSGTE